jgi:serine/threonine-protein kinase
MEPGELIGGKYRLLRLIGDGGMGSVYEARHEVLGSGVALKFLHPELAQRPGLALRFLQEARVAANIQSPHVARVSDVDRTADGSPYLVMELLTGETLQQLLDRRPKLRTALAIDFAIQIAAGLEAAHAINVVHRDLKPDNVFITPSAGGPVLKLLDFGIAKLKTDESQKGLTRPGAVMGTPEYMAPEQLYAADQVDHRADVYSLGAMLYEMLGGQRPAAGDDAAAIIAKVATGQVRRLSELEPSLAEELVALVHRAMAPEREQRLRDAGELRLALLPFATELSHAARLAASSPLSSGSVTPKTEDEPPLARKSEAVAPTLPPEDGPAGPDVSGGRGSTVEAPKDLIRRITAEQRARAAVPNYAASQLPPTPPPLARRRKPWGAILALVGGLGVIGAGIALAFALQLQRTDEPVRPIELSPPSTPSEQPPAAGAATLQPELPGPPPVAVSPPPAPQTTSRPTRPTTPRPSVDAGAAPDAGGAADAAGPVPFPTFPLPSSFPSTLPIPSGLPPLPSGFPQIPGLPGQPPPTNQSGSGQ